MSQKPGEQETDWIKLDLHIHTLDDPKDALDYTAHQLLERAQSLGFRVLAITLHDAVFNREEVFADAAQMGILLIPAAEVRLEGADVILLNISAKEIEALRCFDDLVELRRQRGDSLYTIAPHPFYVLGGSIGKRLIERIDCFDAIELCHFWTPFVNPNQRAVEIAAHFKKPLIATSDAHRLHAFGTSYTTMPPLPELTVENVIAALRSGPLQTTCPPCGFADLVSTMFWLFVHHPIRLLFSRRLI
jgi:predicted metal-dependent phosphoesterase TrpH